MNQTTNPIAMRNTGAIWNVLNEWMRSGASDPIDEILSGIKSYMENIKEIRL